MSIKERASKLKKISFSAFSVRLSRQEQVSFTKRLGLLVKSGVPLLEGLHMLEKQSKGGRKKIFEQISRDIANGKFLHKSLGQFPRMFGVFAINLIRVGEISGTLSENLRYLAEEIEKQRKLRQKVISALIYPAVIMVSAFGVSGLMTVYLFPKLLPVFKTLNVDLPFTTRALIFISDMLLRYWWALGIGLIILIIAFVFAMRIKRFRFIMHSIFLRIPVVGGLLKNYYLTNISRTLGVLFKSNVRVLEAITVTADTTANLVYERELRNLHDAIKRGGSIAKQLEDRPRLFPPMLTQMITIGERTGNLSDTLLYIGEIYEGELDEETKRLSSLIEPAMMLCMGVLVGFIAVSIITPIYEVTQHLNPK